MVPLRRNRDFLVLWSAQLVSTLGSQAPITADRAVLDSSELFVGVRRPEFAAEVTGPHDGASVLADEAREQLAQRRRKLAELDD